MDHVTAARTHGATVMTQRLREMRLDPPRHDRRALRRGDRRRAPPARSRRRRAGRAPARTLHVPLRSMRHTNQPTMRPRRRTTRRRISAVRARRGRDLAEEPREVGGVAERHDARAGVTEPASATNVDASRISTGGTGTSCHVGVTSLAGASACSGSAVTGSSARTSRRRAAAAAARPSQRIGPSGCIHASERSGIGLAAQRLPDAAYRRVRGVRDRRVLRSAEQLAQEQRAGHRSPAARFDGQVRRADDADRRTVERRAQHVRGDEAADGAVVRARHERGERGIGPGLSTSVACRNRRQPCADHEAGNALGQQLGDPRQVCVLERADGCHWTGGIA